MEVSAKTGTNIKQFFKELACVIAGGGKKSKEQATKNAIPTNQAPPQPIKSQNQAEKIDLSKAVDPK